MKESHAPQVSFPVALDPSSFPTRPFLPFRPFFGTQGQVPANGTGSFNTCRSFLRVCPSHFTFRRVSRRRLSPLPQLGSFSSRVLRACPPEWRSERRRKRRTVHGKSEMRKSWMDGWMEKMADL